MPPLISTVFALPGHLVAKADPRLIADDEQHFAAITETVAGAVAELSARLDGLRMADGGGGRRASDRDLEIHELTSRLRTLRRYRLDLCLGRVVTDDGEAVYIGRVGLLDRDGRQLLVDWRAPAAKPFFAATTAHREGVTSRRRYRWAGGRIVDYWDEVFTADGRGGPVALDDDSAFLAMLGASRSTQMRDVLATIAADQDEIIRSNSRGALVVDGGPGTGKTVVALHRAAYLLYSDARLAGNRGRLLVVGPHEPYLAYISDVLPSLGEEGVQTCTLRDLLPEGTDAADESNPVAAQLKSSMAMVDAIETAVRWYEEVPAEPLDVETYWADVRITRTDWREAFGSVEPGTPHNEAPEQLWASLITTVRDRLADPEISASALRKSLSENDDVVSTIRRAWPMLDATDLIGDLWTVPAFLRMCAPWLSPDEIRLLQRDDPHAWTTADLPLLDAARRRLGDRTTAVRRARRAAVLANERTRMDRVVEDLLDANVHDDGEGLLPMLRRQDLRDVLVDESAAPGVQPGDLDGPFAHIIVDEAQELTDAQWRMLIDRCPANSYTIVGDRAQARAGFTESWAQRLTRVGLGEVRVMSLNVNYRTPVEIMAAAEPVIRAAIPDANVPESIRSSGIPVRYASVTERDQIIDDWLDGHADGTVCVIGDPTFRRTPRVRSLSPVQAKGLEFDLVVLVDPDVFGDDITGAVERYVAMTRATQELVVLR